MEHSAAERRVGGVVTNCFLSKRLKTYLFIRSLPPIVCSARTLISDTYSWLTYSITDTDPGSAIMNTKSRRKRAVKLQGIFTIQSGGNFPTSPSTCPTSPLVTASVLPFSVIIRILLFAQKHSKHEGTVRFSTVYILIMLQASDLVSRVYPRDNLSCHYAICMYILSLIHIWRCRRRG